MQKFMRPQQLIILLLLGLISSSCSSWHFPRVYKIELAQGNKIEAAQLKKLAPGMTQKQVIYLLGSPLVQDPLQTDRWDYYYYLKPSGHAKAQTKHVVIFFNQDLYDHYTLLE